MMKKTMRLKEDGTKSPSPIIMSIKIVGKLSKLCHDQKMRYIGQYNRKHYG